ncbi:hypothetical protein [Mycobacterium sp. PSTR-4-N]|uniref:hypothetical protein n=1 Tax=Mycobacterium sp. PSTR-4-N TaxID=2917745 RepID=UPI001F14E3D1|nr:hypothetical protein [Mycobacterium sp. PSTR-4-N]MCG7596333.1 hypothetical protein [Mycobacterium sp. PSTR-4-N]
MKVHLTPNLSTFVTYEPPEPMFRDTILAFQALTAPQWVALIEPDPLGPVNRIVSLMRNDERIKSLLCHVPEGADVEVVRDEGGYRIDDLFALKDLQWRPGGYGQNVATAHVPFRSAGWRIEINGRTVLAVADAEMRTPYTPPPPPPLWHRMRTALREQLRADVDAVAKRLGFHRIDECGGWDE